MELTGKVVLITGGGTGLGREAALLLAQEGMLVAVSFSRSRAEAEQTVADIQALGGHAAAFQADLSRTTEAESLVQEVAHNLWTVRPTDSQRGDDALCPLP